MDTNLWNQQPWWGLEHQQCCDSEYKQKMEYLVNFNDYSAGDYKNADLHNESKFVRFLSSRSY